MILKNLIAVVSTITICTLSICAPVGAANKKMNDKDWNERRAYLEENMRDLGSQGEEAVQKFLEENNVIKAEEIEVEDQGKVRASSNGSVTLKMYTYYDRYSQRYLVKGTWTWSDIDKIDSKPGAVDGISLSMYTTDYKAVSGYEYASNPGGITVYDNNGKSYSDAGGVSKISKSGIAYTFKDGWKNSSTYVGYSGSVWFWLNKKPINSTIYVNMNFQHTYSSATLKSCGISWTAGEAPSINMNFENTPSNWIAANQITVKSWPNYI